MSRKLYSVGMYIRLSQADKRADESVSVENQRSMLSQFISHMPNWVLVQTYIDDGASGGNFNRKGFQDMMEDVQSGFVNLVLVKDLSRFGRNYLEAGRYLEEELPALGCRFVALQDNIDTEGGENDILPFLNAINDFYLRDVSERIKSVMRAKAKDGQKLTGAAPYGYIRRIDERNRLTVDDVAAKVVQRVFRARAKNMGYTAIAGMLNNDGITPPRAKIWSTRTIKLMLNNEIYIGNTISLKRGTRSYRDSRTYVRDESEWVKVENTHTPLVSMELWDKVQQINAKAKKHMEYCKPPRPNLFASLLVCPDCGMKMNRLNKTYICSTYQRSGYTICTPHKIMERDLTELVHSHIKGLAEQMELDESAMLKNLRDGLLNDKKADRADVAKQKKALEQQLHTLELQIDQLYEDKVSCDISVETFALLAGNIEAKRMEVEANLTALVDIINEVQAKTADINKWVTLIKGKSISLEVDRDMLTALVEKIEIGEKAEVDGQPHQDIRIYYKFVGLC